MRAVWVRAHTHMISLYVSGHHYQFTTAEPLNLLCPAERTMKLLNLLYMLYICAQDTHARHARTEEAASTRATGDESAGAASINSPVHTAISPGTQRDTHKMRKKRMARECQAEAARTRRRCHR